MSEHSSAPASAPTPPEAASAAAERTGDGPRARVIVISGASGSGKSRLARALCAQYGWPFINLDDFYRDHDEPGLPRLENGEIDWDNPGTWNALDAAHALETLCRTGRVNAPLYSISTSRRSGRHEVRLGDHRYAVAEGIFAPHVLAELSSRGLLAQAWYLDRPRTVTAARRFIRDVAEHRKPLGVLVRRGYRLWRAEPSIKEQHLALGATPVPFKTALSHARALAAADA